MSVHFLCDEITDTLFLWKFLGKKRLKGFNGYSENDRGNEIVNRKVLMFV